MSVTTVPPGDGSAAKPANLARGRLWLSALGAAAVIASMLPPLEPLARRYLYAETIQFCVFAIAGPALIVLGAPWRRLGLSRRDPAAPLNRADAAAGPADRMAVARAQRPYFRLAGGYLLAFMAVVLIWRLPPVTAALLRHPALVVLEMAMLTPTGVGVWLELVPSPPLAPRLPRPHRATIAALAMWLNWVIAYAVGMNQGAVFGAFARIPGRALSMMADQEISSAITWVVAGCAFIPVVLITMFSWLSAGESAEELQRRTRDANHRPVVRGWGPGSGAPL